jgi:hypothetical protein
LQSVAPEDLRSPDGQALFQKCLELFSAGGPIDFDRLMLATENPAWKSLLVELDDEAQKKRKSDVDQRLHDVLNEIERHRRTSETRQQLARLRDGSLDELAEEEILDQFMQTLRGRQPGSEPTDG